MAGDGHYLLPVFHGTGTGEDHDARTSHLHVANNHSGLLPEQIAELQRVREALQTVLDCTSDALGQHGDSCESSIEESLLKLRELVDELDRHQIERIQDNVSKTRLSILFYSLLRDSVKVADNAARLWTVFEDFQNHRGDAE